MIFQPKNINLCKFHFLQTMERNIKQYFPKEKTKWSLILTKISYFWTKAKNKRNTTSTLK